MRAGPMTYPSPRAVSALDRRGLHRAPQALAHLQVVDGKLLHIRRVREPSVRPLLRDTGGRWLRMWKWYVECWTSSATSTQRSAILRLTPSWIGLARTRRI